jgi:glycosidase
MKSWIPDAVIYQVNLRSLAAREPRNAIEAVREKAAAESPLAYVTRNLGSLRKLGANVLYFMPPYPIGRAFRKGIGSPYSSRDFRAIEPEYGTLDEMAALIGKAHTLGFKVLFDITPNHTSRDHVWIDRHPDYYVKRENGEVFYDADWSDTAKLDYTRPGLRREMIETYDYWFSLLGAGADGRPDGIDGFRLDMAHFINDKSFWNDALPELRARHAGRDLLFLAECYGMDNNMDLFARGINAAYDDDFFKVCVYLYGLGESGESAIVPAAGLEQNDSFRDRFQAFQARGMAGAMEAALMRYETALPAGPSAPRLARYTDNHDEGRGLYLFGPGAARAVNQLIFMSPHTLPFLLTGQEFGALNRPSIHDRLTPIGKKQRIQTARGAYEKDAVEFEGNLFARGAAERRDWYAFFQALIRLRRKTPELIHGSFVPVDAGEDAPPPRRAVIAFDRVYRRSTVRCAVNLGPEPRRIQADRFSGQLLYGRVEETLPPFSGFAVRRPDPR